MGASVMYDVIWLGGLLRGRDKDSEYSIDASSSMGMPDRATEDNTTTQSHNHSAYQDQGQSGVWDNWDNSMMNTELDEPDFPFGIWDDALYMNWANGSIAYEVSDWNGIFD